MMPSKCLVTRVWRRESRPAVWFWPRLECPPQGPSGLLVGSRRTSSATTGSKATVAVRRSAARDETETPMAMAREGGFGGMMGGMWLESWSSHPGLFLLE